jgi:hypothetical protein
LGVARASKIRDFAILGPFKNGKPSYRLLYQMDKNNLVADLILPTYSLFQPELLH